MSKAYKLQVKVEPWSSKASCLNIDLEKQTDVKGCLVCISIDYFLSYKLHSERGKSFHCEDAMFQKAERGMWKGKQSKIFCLLKLNSVWIPSQGRINQKTFKSQNPPARTVKPELSPSS